MKKKERIKELESSVEDLTAVVNSLAKRIGMLEAKTPWQPPAYPKPWTPETKPWPPPGIIWNQQLGDSSG